MITIRAFDPALDDPEKVVKEYVAREYEKLVVAWLFAFGHAVTDLAEGVTNSPKEVLVAGREFVRAYLLLLDARLDAQEAKDE